MEFEKKDKVEIKILDFEGSMRIGGESHSLSIYKCDSCRYDEKFLRDDHLPYDGEVWTYFVSHNFNNGKLMKGHWSYIKGGKLTVRLNDFEACPSRSNWFGSQGMFEGSEEYEKIFFPLFGTQLDFTGNITYQMSY